MLKAFQKDRERAVYGLKEKNLGKTYIKLMGLGMRDPDSIRLLNWKKPTEKDVCIPIIAASPITSE
jgi:DNA ligase 4